MAVNPKPTRQQSKRLQIKCLRAASSGRVLLLEPTSCMTADILKSGFLKSKQRRDAKRTVKFEKRVWLLMNARRSARRPLARFPNLHQRCCFGFML